MDCEGKILLIDFISPNPDNCVRVLWGAEEGRRRDDFRRFHLALHTIRTIITDERGFLSVAKHVNTNYTLGSP